MFTCIVIFCVLDSTRQGNYFASNTAFWASTPSNIASSLIFGTTELSGTTETYAFSSLAMTSYYVKCAQRDEDAGTFSAMIAPTTGAIRAVQDPNSEPSAVSYWSLTSISITGFTVSVTANTDVGQTLRCAWEATGAGVILADKTSFWAASSANAAEIVLTGGAQTFSVESLTPQTEYDIECGISTQGASYTSFKGNTYTGSSALSTAVAFYATNQATAPAPTMGTVWWANQADKQFDVEFTPGSGAAAEDIVRCVAHTSAISTLTTAQFWAASINFEVELTSGTLTSQGSGTLSGLTDDALYYVGCASSSQPTAFTLLHTSHSSSVTTPTTTPAIYETHTGAPSADLGTPTISEGGKKVVVTRSDGTTARCMAKTANSAPTKAEIWAATTDIATLSGTDGYFTTLTDSTTYYYFCANSMQVAAVTAATVAFSEAVTTSVTASHSRVEAGDLTIAATTGTDQQMTLTDSGLSATYYIRCRYAFEPLSATTDEWTDLETFWSTANTDTTIADGTADSSLAAITSLNNQKLYHVWCAYATDDAAYIQASGDIGISSPIVLATGAPLVPSGSAAASTTSFSGTVGTDGASVSFTGLTVGETVRCAATTSALSTSALSTFWSYSSSAVTVSELFTDATSEVVYFPSLTTGTSYFFTCATSTNTAALTAVDTTYSVTALTQVGTATYYPDAGTTPTAAVTSTTTAAAMDVDISGISGEIARCVASSDASDATFSSKSSFWAATAGTGSIIAVVDGDSAATLSLTSLAANAPNYVYCACGAHDLAFVQTNTDSSSAIAAATQVEVVGLDNDALAALPDFSSSTVINLLGGVEGGVGVFVSNSALANTYIRCAAGTDAAADPFDSLANFWGATSLVVDKYVATGTTETQVVIDGLVTGTTYFIKCGASLQSPAVTIAEIGTIAFAGSYGAANPAAPTIGSVSISAEPSSSGVFTAGNPTTVSMGDSGASVSLPSNALSSGSVQVTLAQSLTSAQALTKVQSYAGASAAIASTPLSLQPHGQTFTRCVTITLPYTAGSLGGQQPTLYYADDDDSSFQPYQETLVTFDGTNAVTCVYHFSTWVIGTPVPTSSTTSTCAGTTVCKSGLCFQFCE